MRKIAEQMGGSSGAEVKGTCTEAGQDHTHINIKASLVLCECDFLFMFVAGMYALRERRVHVTQEDFEMAVAKIMQKDTEKNMSIKKLFK